MNWKPEALDYRLLFEESPGLFLVLAPNSPTFTILGASNAYLKATMTEREQITGKGLFEVFPDNPADLEASGKSNLLASLERVLANQVLDVMAIQKYDIRRPLEQGGGFETRFWSPRNSPVLQSSGEVKYLLHRVEDVTAFVQANKKGEELQSRSDAMELEAVERSRELEIANTQLRTANEKLAVLDRAKTEFFSNVSHEFRTPLTLILGPVEECLKESSSDVPVRYKERLLLIHQNALRLLRHVNALLDFSRVEAGRMRAEYVPTDIATFTAQICSSFQSTMDQVGLNLVIECKSPAGYAYVDRGMWEKIVLNLMSNAFKHTFEGEIAVRVWETPESYCLAVTDTGAGIPPADIEHIFERFHRVQGARARTHEGTGIGLSLVAELVNLHGGQIHAQSVLGEGSVFTVSIPKGHSHLPSQAVHDNVDKGFGESWRPSAPKGDPHGSVDVHAWLSADANFAPPNEHPAPNDQAGTDSPRVLVVDDNAHLRSYISGLLRPYYNVEVAIDGEDALRAIENRPPDLVLSDVMMPRLDGFGLLRALRSDPATRTTPFILLSARAGEESTIDGLNAGADDCLAKPFSTAELLARVRTHLELARNRQAWAKELELANSELEAFSYSVSHDLRAPLRAIDGFSKALVSSNESNLDEQGRHYLHRIRAGTQRMSQLIDDLLNLSRISRVPLREETVDLSRIANEIVQELRRLEPERQVDVTITEGLTTRGDRRLLAIALENLLGNAWKFSKKSEGARIQFGREQTNDGPAFLVRDNGVGFDMTYADKLFAPFQRLHKASEFEGTGVGLATVRRIIGRHGGRIWAHAALNEGATFFFAFGDIAK